MTSDADPPPRRTVLVSAHRGGSELAAPGTYEAYAAAADLGADYAEFDVRQTRDQVLVAFHPARAGRAGARRPVASLLYGQLCALAGYQVPQVSELIRLLAGRSRAHVDLKDRSCAARAVAEVRRVLPAEDVVVTTRDAALARSLGHLAPVGLTVGGDAARTAGYRLRRAVRPGAARLGTVTAAGAAWAVVQYRSAGLAVLAEARRRGLKIMVWTVNGERELGSWLAAASADVIVTDEPGRAIALRGAPPRG
jgi:glycerophosphoryl diester phosphodiesterase